MRALGFENFGSGFRIESLGLRFDLRFRVELSVRSRISGFRVRLRI